jgi:2-polyprenyl-3-methyl-5-hydroxy-6-metoxy-1,4-benzoquinol methylase
LSSKDEHHGGLSEEHRRGQSRHGAKQPEVFNPARAALLDDPRRFELLPPDDIVRLLDAPSGGVVVDFGAGTGTFSIELARRRPDLKIIALDQQPEMLELLKARPVSQLTGIQPMLSDQSASIAGTVDRVFAINVLHEVGDSVLDTMAALLNPQGSLLIIDWDAAIDRTVGPPKDHTHTAAEARARLLKSGFEVEALEPLRYHFVLRARRAARDQRAGNR